MGGGEVGVTVGADGLLLQAARRRKANRNLNGFWIIG
jgi:hypothetical protein